MAFCEHCGSSIPEGQNVCPNCQKPTLDAPSAFNAANGLGAESVPVEQGEKPAETIPETRNQQEPPVPPVPPAPKKPGKKKRWLIPLIIVLVLAIIGGGIFAAIKLFSDAEPEEENPVEETKEDQKPTKSDAEEYYSKNATIIKKINAKSSNDVLTEAQVLEMLQERGFVDYEITYQCSMDGEYCGETQVANDSTEKHPIYQTMYMSTTGEAWVIMVINGTIMANPVSYNSGADVKVETLVSETEELVSYDPDAGVFFVTKPFETAAVVKKVDKINAETLDSLTVEELSK